MVPLRASTGTTPGVAPGSGPGTLADINANSNASAMNTFHQRARLRPRPPWPHGIAARRNPDLFAIAASGGSSADPTGVPSASEAFCDQCGDAFLAATPESVLAVCRAPGCGVEFSQCLRCERDYAGCCSVACQAFATPQAVSQVTPQMPQVDASRGSRRRQQQQQQQQRGVPDQSTASRPDKSAKLVENSSGSYSLKSTPYEKEELSTAAGPYQPKESGGREFKGADRGAVNGVGTEVGQAVGAEATRGRGGASVVLNGISPGDGRGTDGVNGDAVKQGVLYSSGVSAKAVAVDGGNGRRGWGRRLDGGEKLEETEPALESYASRHSTSESSSLAKIREATNRAQPGGAHMVSGHLQGELLKLLTRLCRAKRVLDVGTFTGYSALAFAEALPEDGEVVTLEVGHLTALPEDGTVVTLESDARSAEIARRHFGKSQHGAKIRLLVGQAMDGIDQLIEEGSPQFDVIFIDADKKRYWDYYEKALEGPRPLLAPAGILLADNVLFHELVPLAEASLSAQKSPRNFPAPAREEEVPRREEPLPHVHNFPGISPAGANEEGEEPRRDEASLPAAKPPGAFPAAGKWGEEPRRNAAVGSGVLAATPRRMKIAQSLDGFNKKVRDDCRVEALMLPLRDGLSVVRWRDGGYPVDT